MTSECKYVCITTNNQTLKADTHYLTAHTYG